MGSWSWIWLSAAASLAIVLLNNRLILNFSNNKLNLMSAWLGAAPLIGSLAISLLFYLTPLREFYPFAIALLSTGIGLLSLLQLETQKAADDFMQQQKVDSVGLLQYGFLLGFAVAIVNTFVYLRLGEIYHATPSEVAQTGSLLIAIASFAGVLASLSAGSSLLGKVPRLLLARVAPALIAFGILVLLLGTDIAWAGLAGVLVAVGFGLVNGLELSLVQIASSGLADRIQLFGTYLAMSTVPYVIAGLSGLALIRESLGTWPLFLIAFAAAVLSIAFLRRSRQTN